MAVTLGNIARAAVALGIALIWFIELPPAKKTSTANVADGAAFAAVVQALENKDLDHQAQTAAEKVGVGAAGDTCFMRYAALPFTTDRPMRARFAHAAALTDPERKLAALEQLALQGQPHQTWRARYGQAIVALRTKDTQRAARYLGLAAAVADMPPACRADESFLAALLPGDPDASMQALVNAFDLDRGSWGIASALALRLPVAADAGMGCERAAGYLVQAVVQLSHLTQSDSQLARLSRFVANEPDRAGPNQKILSRLLVGLVEERSNHPDMARATYAKGLALAQESSVCGTGLPEFFESRIAAVQGTKNP